MRFIIIAIIAVLLDALTKSGLVYMLTGTVPLTGDAFQILPYPYMIARITDWFNLVFTWNPGTSFSLFRNLGESAPIIIVVLTGLIILFLLHQLIFRASKTTEKYALALIVGGALGNLIDRLRFGAVADFIDWHIGDWHWPAFNLADVFICAGVAVYILSWIIQRNKK
ncbi:MAG: signal peptidase II [Rickettsiales bacterium]|jgi:signal peptidase II|nr:signal peptidase II [Rickettsiales bacterium]